jgi:hypothetical protein
MRRIPIVLCLLVLGATPVGNAAAQSASCAEMSAELASLGAPRRDDAIIERQRAEVARLRAYHREIGCEGGGFGFFGRPAECNAINHRLHTMSNLSAQLDSRSAGELADNDRRRRELRAAIARHCTSRPPERTVSSQRTKGGSRLVCVRICDGFFFPLPAPPKDGSTPAELCRASCPNAETALFHAPADGDIEQAVSERGKPYMQLANASRYKKVYDPACSCKAKGETWAQVLRGAEALVSRHKEDVIVTAAKAEEMARPKHLEASTSGKDRAAKRGQRRGVGRDAAPSDQAIDTTTTGSIKRRKRR